MLLGIGGVRALRLWSRLTGAPAPDVYHTNEGHAGFLGHRADPRADQPAPHVLRRGAGGRALRHRVHHPHAGAGRHRPLRRRPDPDVLRRRQRPRRASRSSGCSQLGAENYPGGEPGVFNMAVMGLRLGARANGVSQLHGVVSRHMFDGLWPGFDDTEVPITSDHQRRPRTHLGRPQGLRAGGQAPGHHRRGPTTSAWERIGAVPGDEIWATKRELREQLVKEARRRVRSSWVKRGASRAELGWVDNILDPDVLTIGFARRVPTYKRLTLILRDPDAAEARCCCDPERPIQLVIAGKSHPADETGKKLIQQMVKFADDPEVRHRIVFLPNYDIAMAQYLYPGCDVWLNNPLRPFEACGTSGMKAALNGGLNLSILDGWWDEWYDGENGWAIPTADGVEDPDRRDDLEAAALYDLIETSVAPRFYDRDDDRAARALALDDEATPCTTLGPKVLASRQVARLHRASSTGPAARAGWALNGPEYAGAKSLAAFKAKVRGAWSGVRVDHVESSGVVGLPAGRGRAARAGLRLPGRAVAGRRRGAGRARADVRVRRPARRRDGAADLRGVLRGRPAPVRG